MLFDAVHPEPKPQTSLFSGPSCVARPLLRCSVSYNPAEHALPDADTRPAQAVEAQPHGPGIAQAMGALYQGQRGNARAHEGVDKKRARLNCIHHLLQQGDLHHEPIAMPEREHQPDYARHPVPKEWYVPAVY